MRIRLPKTPFSISLTLHISVLVLVLVSSVFQGCSEPEEVFVFEMVNLDSPLSEQVQESAPASEPLLEIEPLPTPRFSALQPAEKRPVIEEPVASISPRPVETVRPEPQHDPEPQRMTLEEYRRQFGEPKPQTRQQPSRSAQPRINVPTIDTNSITQSLQNAANQSTQATSTTTANEMAEYGRRVKVFLESEWKRQNVSLPAQSLFATVQFWYDSSGRVTRYRVVKKSGLPALDRGVESMFASLRTIPAPPDRKAGSFTIPVGVE